jgi:hypothetical protein
MPSLRSSLPPLVALVVLLVAWESIARGLSIPA